MPPTSRSPFGVPSPLAPWQAAHLAANICAPCATDPDPGGKPLPSGGILMSALVTSSGVAGRPNFGGAMSAARAAEVVSAITTIARDAARRACLRSLSPPRNRCAISTLPQAEAGFRPFVLNIGVAHFARRGDSPTLDRVVVEVLARRVLRDPFGAR